MAALALIGVQLQGMRLGRQSRQHWAANQLLRDEMARIQDMAPDFYPGGTITFSGKNGDARTSSGFPPLPYPGGQRDGTDFLLTVTHQPSGPEGHVFTIKADWTGGSAQLTTLVGP